VRNVKKKKKINPEMKLVSDKTMLRSLAKISTVVSDLDRENPEMDEMASNLTEVLAALAEEMDRRRKLDIRVVLP